MTATPKTRRTPVQSPWQRATGYQPPEHWPWIVPYAFRTALDYSVANGTWSTGTPPRFSFKAGDTLHHRSGTLIAQVKEATPDTPAAGGFVLFTVFTQTATGITALREALCSQADFAAGLQNGGLIPEETSPPEHLKRTTDYSLSSLRALFRRLTSGPADPPIVEQFPPHVSGTDGDDITVDIGDSGTTIGRRNIPVRLLDFHASLTRLPSDARGTAIGLCYIDAKGVETMRRVRINDVYGAGTVYISAFCYERMAPRLFCLDRVKFIFDLDGVVHDDPAAYFRDTFALDTSANDDRPDISSPAPVAPARYTPPPPRPGVALRRLAGDQMLLLLAVARSDQRMVKPELDIIVRYCCDRATASGLPYTAEDRQRLAAYLQHHYPSPETIDAILDRADATIPAGDRKPLLEAVEAVITADGKVTDGETGIRRLIKDAIADTLPA